MIIAQEYNFDKLFNRVKTLIERCMGNTWKEVQKNWHVTGIGNLKIIMKIIQRNNVYYNPT